MAPHWFRNAFTIPGISPEDYYSDMEDDPTLWDRTRPDQDRAHRQGDPERTPESIRVPTQEQQQEQPMYLGWLLSSEPELGLEQFSIPDNRRCNSRYVSWRVTPSSQLCGILDPISGLGPPMNPIEILNRFLKHCRDNDMFVLDKRRVGQGGIVGSSPVLDRAYPCIPTNMRKS